MIQHLDENGSWVVLVYAIALVALLIATGITLVRTRRRKQKLDDEKS